MEDHTTSRTRQTRLKDYLPERQTDAQALSPASAQGEQPSSVLIETDAAPLEKEGPIPTAPPQGKTENRSLAFFPTLKMRGIALRSRSAAGKDRRFLLICGLLCLAVLLMVGGLYAWMRVRALPPAQAGRSIPPCPVE